MQAEDFPLTFIYSEGFKNVSGQVLEVENSLIPSGHVWNRLTSSDFLSPEQVLRRGAATQKLIERGYISRIVFAPLIPRDFLYLESEGGLWFKLNSEDLDPDDDPSLSEEEEVQLRDSLNLSTELISSLPEGCVSLDFDLIIPEGQSLLMELDSTYMSGVRCLDTNARLRLDKRLRKSLVSIAQPIAVPWSRKVYYKFSDLNLRLVVTDEGEVSLTAF